MRISLLLVTTFSLLAAMSAAARHHVEVGAGVSFTRDNEDTQVAAIAWLPRWREFHGGVLRWEFGAMHIRGRHHSRYDNAEYVRLAHAGLRYERPNGLIGGFGIGVQHGQTAALSGDPQFISSIGWRWNRVALMFRHVSNARIQRPNDGENILQAAWRF